MELFKDTRFDFLGWKWLFITASLLLTFANCAIVSSRLAIIFCSSVRPMSPALRSWVSRGELLGFI